MGNCLTKKVVPLPQQTFKANVTSSIPSEVWDLGYKLENFKATMEDKTSIEDIHWEFEAGDTIGIPSKWSLFMDLEECEAEDAIGVFLQLEDSPKEVEKLFAEFHLEVDCKEDGEFERWGHTKKWNFKRLEEPSGCHNVLSLSYKAMMSPESNWFPTGSLTIKLHFIMFGNLKHNTEQSCIKENVKFQRLSQLAVIDDISKILKSGLNSDFVIQTKDLKAFKVHRLILAARSPVFQAMLETKMKEKDTGRVEIDDISSKAMDIFLEYLYAGSLKKGWIKVADEIVYVAEKYDLPLLKEFCDHNLINACTPDSALNLITLAKRHSLNNAVVDISSFIRDKLGSVLHSIPNA